MQRPHASSLAPLHAPLYDPSFEHDACGVGLVVDVAGRPSRAIVERALRGLVNLTHRGGVGADSRSGDGAGLLARFQQVRHGVISSSRCSSSIWPLSSK